MPITTFPVDRNWGGERDRGLHVVLVNPQIPPNTGTIARLCAGTGAWLHLVRPLGFELADRHLKRAGLDYWPNVGLTVHESFDAVEAVFPSERMTLFSARAETGYHTRTYPPGSVLVFGCETKGLPESIRDRHRDRLATLPLKTGKIRSLNLSNAVSIAVYEALRQRDFAFPDGPNSTS